MSGGCPHSQAKAIGLLALRLVVAYIFIKMGWAKLGANHAMASGMFAGMGLPGSGSVWAYIVGGLEVLGGLMVLLGVYARVAAAWLAVIIVVALLTVHRGAIMTSFVPLIVLGACLSLLGTGAGKYRLVKAECCCKACKAFYGEAKAGGCCGGKGACACGSGKMEGKKK